MSFEATDFHELVVPAAKATAMPVVIRPAEKADVAFTAEMRAQRSGSPSFWADRIDRYLRGEYSPQQALALRSAFVAVDQMTILGFVAGHLTRRFGCDGEVQWIDVDQGRRGAGIGYGLMAQMGTWFVSANAGRICVNVDPNNIAARRLYAKCGAQSLNDFWMIWDSAHLICAPQANSRT